MTLTQFFSRFLHTQLVRGSLVLAVAGFIVLMTSQPATESSLTSQTIGLMVANFLLAIPFSDLFLPKMGLPLDPFLMAPALDHVVRKTAHFVEYAALGFVLVAWLRHTKTIGSKCYWLTPLMGFLFAASDEFHQTFVPGRSGQLSDVMLDWCGCLAGLMAYCLMKGIFRRYVRRSEKEENAVFSGKVALRIAPN